MHSTRKSAKLAGAKEYFTGIPCKRGHVSARYTSTLACMECLNIHKKSWRSLQENSQKEAAYAKRYRAENSARLRDTRLNLPEHKKESGRQRSREWKARNAERMAAYCSAYKKSKPAENANRTARYIAAKLKATPPWADAIEIAKVYEDARVMTELTGEPHEVDHFYPIRGRFCCGLHVHTNLRVVPATENRRKYNKMPHDMIGYTKLVADTLTPAESL